MLKICPGKFHSFVERFKNLLKTYINYDKTPLPLFVDKAVKIVSTLVQYIKELFAYVASAYRKALIIAHLTLCFQLQHRFKTPLLKLRYHSLSNGVLRLIIKKLTVVTRNIIVALGY